MNFCDDCNAQLLQDIAPADGAMVAQQRDRRRSSNGSTQQPTTSDDERDRSFDSDNKRRRLSNDEASRGSVGSAEATGRKRQRIHDCEDDDDVILLDEPPIRTTPSPPPASGSQQQKELTVTNPSQLPSASLPPPTQVDSDAEVDDDVPLVLRPSLNKRSSTDKQSTAAAAAPAPSVSSPFSTSASGKRRLSKSTAKAPTTPAATSTAAPAPAMSPSQPTKHARSPSNSSAASSSPPTSAPTTPPGASPAANTAGRGVSSHMTDKLAELIGAQSGGAAFAESVNLFILEHKLSVRDIRDLYFRLLSNLKSNEQLLSRVRSGDVTAEQLCSMNDADMAGDEVRRQREEAKKASIRDVTMAAEMMIAKQTKAGVEYIAVAGDKLTATDMFDEKLTLTGAEGREDGEEGEEGERKEGYSDGKQSATVDGEDEFLSFDEVEQRRQHGSNGTEYESKYASEADDDEVMEQTRATPSSKRKRDSIDGDGAVPAASKSSQASSLPVDGGDDAVQVNTAVGSNGEVSLVLSPRQAAHDSPQIVSPTAGSGDVSRPNVIELDMDQAASATPLKPASSAVQPSFIVIPDTSTPTKPTSRPVLLSPLPALSPASPPQSPPSVIPLPSLQPVASSSAAGLFLGPLQSSSRWKGQLYFNSHNTNIAFTARLMGVAGQLQSNSAVKALSALPVAPATIHIAGREPTSEVAKLLGECVQSSRLMALLYVLHPEAADAVAMEQFCAFHAEKQRVAIADMRRETGLFYRFGRMGALGEALGKEELPLNFFTQCFSGIKGLKDARSYYCVVVYATKRPAGGVGSAVAPQRQDSSSSVSSVASSDSSSRLGGGSSRQRSNQANVVTPPPPTQPVPVYPTYPAPPTAAQPSTFASPPFATSVPVPTPMMPAAPIISASAVAQPAAAGYAGYYPPAAHYPGHLPHIPEQTAATPPSQPYPPYAPVQYNQPAFAPPSQYTSQPYPQQPYAQLQPPPQQPPVAAPGLGTADGDAAAAKNNTDWIQVRKFLESIKTQRANPTAAILPSPTTSQPAAIPPPSPPQVRTQQPHHPPPYSPRRDEDGGAGRYREDERSRASRMDGDRNGGGADAELRRAYDIGSELQRLEEQRRRLDAPRREADRSSRDRDRDRDRDRSAESDRRRDYDRVSEQPRVYDSGRERERERERAEAQHRSRGGGGYGGGGGGGYSRDPQRERIDRIERELREAERERERLAPATAQRPTQTYPPPPVFNSAQQPAPVPKAVSGFIHPSRMGQAPR